MDAVNQAGSPVESVDLTWDRMREKRIHFVILVYFLKLVRCGNMVHNNKGIVMVHTHTITLHKIESYIIQLHTIQSYKL